MELVQAFTAFIFGLFDKLVVATRQVWGKYPIWVVVGGIMWIASRFVKMKVEYKGGN
jgi:hypothetical protein